MLSLFVSCLIVRGQYVSCSTDTCLKCRTLARPKMRCENDRCNKNLHEWNEEIVCRTHCTYGPNGAERGKKDKQNERTNEKKKKHEAVGKKSEIINTNGDPNYCGRILKRVSCTYMNL